MSLRASSRTDSKLVIYGAGGLASAAGNSTQTTPSHHTLKLESSDLRNSSIHKVEPLGATPTTHHSSGATPHRGLGATPPHRGSIGDVEHKTLSSVLRSHTHSGRVSPTTGANTIDHTPSSTRKGHRTTSPQLTSPTRTTDRYGNGFGTPQRSKFTSSSQGSLTRQKRMNESEPPAKVEWYHSDLLSPQDKGSFDGFGRQSSSHRAPSGMESSSRHSGRSYTRSDSVDQVNKYRHSSSTEHFNHDKSTNQMKRFHHSQSVDQLGGHTAPQHQPHRPHHRHTPRREAGESHSPRSHHSGARTRSSRSSSDITVRRMKSGSVPRDAHPRLQEEDEPEGQSSSRYMDRNHPARPQNRGQYRLSLPESSYYDNSGRLARHTHARRSRKALTNTGAYVSSGSLSQPADLGLAVRAISNDIIDKVVMTSLLLYVPLS